MHFSLAHVAQDNSRDKRFAVATDEEDREESGSILNARVPRSPGSSKSSKSSSRLLDHIDSHERAWFHCILRDFFNTRIQPLGLP